MCWTVNLYTCYQLHFLEYKQTGRKSNFQSSQNVRVYKCASEQTVRPIFNCWSVIWAGGKEGMDRRPGALGYRLIVLKEGGTVDTLRLVREKRWGARSMSG
jgi:hypothetical protein